MRNMCRKGVESIVYVSSIFTRGKLVIPRRQLTHTKDGRSARNTIVTKEREQLVANHDI